jgi:hypothetical protein
LDDADLLGTAEFNQRPPTQASAGLLGRGFLTDLLALLLTALIGALLGYVFAVARFRRSALHGQIADLSRSVSDIRKALAAPNKLSAQTPQREPNPPARPLRDDSRRSSPDPAPAPERVSAPAAAPPPSRNQARARGLNQAVDVYCRLVSTKGTKARQLADALTPFPRILAIRQDGASIVGIPYREGEPNQVLIAVGDNEGDGFAVVPTFDYLSDFSMAFSKPVTNPEIVRSLFELVEDGTGQLRIQRPATVEMEEGGRMHVVRKGILAGLTG